MASFAYLYESTQINQYTFAIAIQPVVTDKQVVAEVENKRQMTWA